VTAFGQDTPTGGWILWVEDRVRTDWSRQEAAALKLAGLALASGLHSDDKRPRWAAQLELSARQQTLEAIALVVRRLAHDYGNVLTGLLGFSELGLAQSLHPGSVLHGYLTEVHKGASSAAQFTHQLCMFARRVSLSPTPSSLVKILTEEVGRCGSHFEVRLDLPPDPPAVVLEADQLRQLLIVVLTNAREAVSGPTGQVVVSARVRTLTTEDCLDFYGNLTAGDYVQVTVADNGSGLSTEARRSLFVEPFFTTKPRRRGLGLMVSYGVLHAHRGGLAIESETGQGTVVHLLLPIAATPAPSPTVAEAAPREAAQLALRRADETISLAPASSKRS
jgi:signal transduction histidine kinase